MPLIDGGLFDLAAIGARWREIAAVRPDYLVCAGYNWLLGPYSLGYLYVAPAHQDGRPLDQNWIARAGSDDFAPPDRL